jgi:hypothetical protein
MRSYILNTIKIGHNSIVSISYAMPCGQFAPKNSVNNAHVMACLLGQLVWPACLISLYQSINIYCNINKVYVKQLHDIGRI